MKIVKIIALTAALAAGSTAAFAAPYFGVEVASLESIQEARNATVLSVNSTEARLLGLDNDVSSIRARIQSNPALLMNVQAQGFDVEQIVGVSGRDTGLTLYAL
ncbi:hypothetical protein SAMN05428969_0221 [Devosia sp. YR412]|uniref:hypothetical protein n=1 Tax=Devosia sp. YR412 TaxID=1881030 RepID=UPI0008C42A86|nr:hypothetical protein [Devosia sp. YR412]SEP63153.1 hypothetical protein SAMN05428969_0221 [Devosia sp. YR412]